MKFFLFENNTVFTRARVVNTLVPFFERVKVADGLYDYLIVCDERNNTPEVIDNNELVVDIYLKPVRTAEFILVNFYATRTDTNFQELVGG
jgi:phage tail sheath protein FI